MKSQPPNPEFRNNPENFHMFKDFSTCCCQCRVQWLISRVLD